MIRGMRLLLVAALAVGAASPAAAADREYPVRGLVLAVDAAARSMVVSH